MDANLNGHQGPMAVLATVGLVLASGLIVIVGRSALGRKGGMASFIRSWLAITLVSGLLLFCAFSFELKDSTLRNTLFGGLVASAGAAVAFYFASSSSDQARIDILGAAFGTTQVPNLVGQLVPDAQTTMATVPLALEISPTGAVGKIASQIPAAGSMATKGSTLQVVAAAN